LEKGSKTCPVCGADATEWKESEGALLMGRWAKVSGKAIWPLSTTFPGGSNGGFIQVVSDTEIVFWAPDNASRVETFGIAKGGTVAVRVATETGTSPAIAADQFTCTTAGGC
jgi:hypothetical protein